MTATAQRPEPEGGEPTGALDDAPPAARRWKPGRLWRQLLVAGLVYLGVSLLVWARIWVTGSPSHSVTCPCGDVAEQLWWFEWFPRALLHGHSPFFSTALFARFGGINGMTNTSWMLPAALLTPITLVFGPVASSNTANLLAPVVTGLAAYALAARFTRLAVARGSPGSPSRSRRSSWATSTSAT